MKNAILPLSILLSLSLFAIPARADVATNQDAWAKTFREPVIPASADGGYQLRRIGKKFLMVLEPNGAPVVVFDLSLTPVTTFEMILGGIGFGDLNLKNLIEIIKKAHHASQEAAAMDGSRAPDAPLSQKEIDRILESGKADARSGDRLLKALRLASGAEISRGTNFTLADLQIKNSKAREAFLGLFTQLMNALDRTNFWDRSNIEQALREIEFRYQGRGAGSDGQGARYQCVWNHKLRARADQATLPGTVINYYDLQASINYKRSLLKLIQGMGYVKELGPVGVVIDLVVSQMTIGMIERQEYHEHQFIALLEAMERFEYSTDDFPPAFVENTLGAVYENLAFATLDKDTSQEYVNKRVQTLTYQEKAKDKVMEKLVKQLPSTDVVTLFAGNKFALVRNQKPGFKAILSSGLKPNWLFGYVTKHVDGKSTTLKRVERELIGAAAALAHALLPSSYFFKIGETGVNVAIDPMVYQQVLRGPMMHEKFLEAELVALVDETLAGRARLPFTSDELMYVKSGLRKALVNAYEVLPEDEDAVIEANYQLIQELAGGSRVPVSAFLEGPT